MCNCNESPFDKLRDKWSRYSKGGDNHQGACNCCCQNGKSKVKGKFGVAYIIETPNRSCKPCGWEVEFNDTPSQIENNCRKMMEWITCPPLGGCQNNNTDMCCCSNVVGDVQNTLKQMCNNSNACGCCKKSNKTRCCCQKPQPKTQKCCCKPLNGRETYMKSKRKCPMRCCDLKMAEEPCCCTAKNNNEHSGCCCCNRKMQQCCAASDSDSSSCKCQLTKPEDKNKEQCACNCNCSECKCSGNTKSKAQSKHNGNKPSKNFNPPETTLEKHKMLMKSPYTISDKDFPKKGPDKENFQSEMTRRVTDKLLPEVEKEIRSVEYDGTLEAKADKNQKTQQQNIKNKSEHDVKVLGLLGMAKERQKERNNALDRQEVYNEKDINQTMPQEQVIKTNEESVAPAKPKRNLKKLGLLKKIKQEQKERADLIEHKKDTTNTGNQHLNENKSIELGQDQLVHTQKSEADNIEGETTLLEKIKTKHKEELKAIGHT